MTTVDRKELARIVEVAAAVAPRRATIPILGCARLRVQGGQLLVEATDLETTVAGEIPCDGPEGDLGIVPARSLLSLLRGIADDRVRLVAAGGRLRLAFEAGTISLALFDAVEWPNVVPDAAGANGAMKVTGAVLARMKRVLYASADPTRATMTGVFAKDGEFVAIDGHRMAKAAGSLSTDAFAISSGSAMAIAAGFADTDEAEVKIGDATISVQRPGLCMSLRARRDGFPPYEQVCASALEGKPIVVPRAELLSAIALLRSIGAENLAFVIVGGKLRVEPRGADGPEGGIEVPIRSGQISDVTIGLDRRYAEQALSQMEGEDLTMYSGAELDPVAFCDGSGNVAVIASMRL